jgi:hypothetical protein
VYLTVLHIDRLAADHGAAVAYRLDEDDLIVLDGVAFAVVQELAVAVEYCKKKT